MTILVTGSSGFIGYHTCKRLLKDGENVIGLDNMNSYYDPKLKEARLESLRNLSNHLDNKFKFVHSELEDKPEIEKLFIKYQPQKVINLAAQAGVRYSIENPGAYIQSNVVGFSNILEGCRHNNIKHLIYASSSSVYGGNTKIPFSEAHGVDHPVSLYAATKKTNELMAHTYSHLYNLPSTGLRFFTVYGPWGRPDMALFLFTKAILNDQPIRVFNNGDMIRDFTYIDDIVESLVRLLKKPPSSDLAFDHLCPNPSTSWAPYRIFNIGNSSPVPLMEYIDAIEKSIGKKAIKEFLPMQPGDVKETFADTSSLEEWVGFKPKTEIQEGVRNFIIWYREYYDS